MAFLFILLPTGHNSDGKFIARAQRIEFDCELIPRRVAIFIEKTKDGQVMPVPNVVVRDVVCGANHTVSNQTVFLFGNLVFELCCFQCSDKFFFCLLVFLVELDSFV